MSTDEPQAPGAKILPLFGAPPLDGASEARPDWLQKAVDRLDDVRAGLLNGSYTGYQLTAGTTLFNPTATFIEGSFAKNPADSLLITTKLLQHQAFALKAATEAADAAIAPVAEPDLGQQATAG